MKYIHAILAIFLCQLAIPIGLLFSPWLFAVFMGGVPDFSLSTSLKSLDMTIMCWLISVPISLLVGFPLVLLSLVKNKFSILRAFYVNFLVSGLAIILLGLIVNWWEMWLGIAVPICIVGTLILAIFFKNYTFLVRPLPMLSMVFLVAFIAVLFTKIDLMSAHGLEVRSYITLDRVMAERIEAERKN